MFDDLIDDIQQEKEASLRLGNLRNALSYYLNPLANLHPQQSHIVEQVAKNWDKPEELAAIYGSRFAKPHEQKEIFEAAGQAKKYKELTEDEAHRQAMIDSFDRLLTNDKGETQIRYKLHSPYFTNNAGILAFRYKKTKNPPENIEIAVQPQLMGRGYANAMEATVLHDFAKRGYPVSTSDRTGRTSSIRQIAHEKRIEKYPDLVEFNPEFVEQFKDKPMYNIKDNEALSNKMFQSGTKKLKLIDRFVEPVGDSALFLPDTVAKQTEGRPVYHFEDVTSLTQSGMPNWNIRRAYPEGYSGGSLDPAHKEFRADPEFIKKHKDQYKDTEYFQAALKKAEEIQNQKKASTALDRYKSITGAGYEYAGNAKKWLHRQILKGKTPEQLGFQDFKKYPGLMELIQKHSPSGEEVAFEYGKGIPSSVFVSGFGGGESQGPHVEKILNMDDESQLKAFNKFTRNVEHTFHTHPYQGVISNPSSILRVLPKETPKEMKQDILNNFKDEMKKIKNYSDVEKAQPFINPMPIKSRKGFYAPYAPGDIQTFSQMPQATHSIFNPETGMYGVHSVRPFGEKDFFGNPMYYKHRDIYRRYSPVKQASEIEKTYPVKNLDDLIKKLQIIKRIGDKSNHHPLVEFEDGKLEVCVTNNRTKVPGKKDLNLINKIDNVLTGKTKSHQNKTSEWKKYYLQALGDGMSEQEAKITANLSIKEKHFEQTKKASLDKTAEHPLVSLSDFTKKIHQGWKARHENISQPLLSDTSIQLNPHIVGNTIEQDGAENQYVTAMSGAHPGYTFPVGQLDLQKYLEKMRAAIKKHNPFNKEE